MEFNGSKNSFGKTEESNRDCEGKTVRFKLVTDVMFKILTRTEEYSEGGLPCSTASKNDYLFQDSKKNK